MERGIAMVILRLGAESGKCCRIWSERRKARERENRCEGSKRKVMARDATVAFQRRHFNAIDLQIIDAAPALRMGKCRAAVEKPTSHQQKCRGARSCKPVHVFGISNTAVTMWDPPDRDCAPL